MNDLLFAPLKGWQPYEDLKAAVSAGGIACAYGMAEGHRPHLAAALLWDTGRPVVLVMASETLAARMADDLNQLLGAGVCLFPAREISFYRTVATSQELAQRRLEALSGMLSGAVRLVVASADALMHRLMPAANFAAHSFTLAEGQRVPLEELTRRLADAGYTREDMVEGKGQFALRGGILDVYPPAALSALRVEFFDDEVDSIRTFDVLTQRSQGRVQAADICPASEALTDGPQGEAAARRLLAALADGPDQPAPSLTLPDLEPLDFDQDDELPSLWDMQPPQAQAPVPAKPPQGGSSPDRCMGEVRDAAASLAAGRRVRGAERWMNLLFDEPHTLLEYLPNAIVLLDEPDRLRERCQNRGLEFVQAFTAALERGEALPAQADLLLDWLALAPLITEHGAVALCGFLRAMGGLQPKRLIQLDGVGTPGYQGQMKELIRDIARWQQEGWRVALLSGGVARGQRLAQTLLEHDAVVPFVEARRQPIAPGEAVILPLALSHGFSYPDLRFVAVADGEIFGVGQVKARARKRTGERIAAFTDLKVGDYVVHENHGVGVYQGTVRLQSEGTYRDYLFIQYQGADKLYVPTDQLDRVQKYIGAEKVTPHINRLGGGEWQRQKARVKQSIRTLAFDLVRLYAQRKATPGFAFSPDTPWQRQFEENFPFEETPDQLQSTMEIKRDMETRLCMDRLLCGDVGYGKTEVALRAAFKAVMDGKQVAILAPTTILAQQHYNTILNRFEGFPVACDVLSRFRSAAQQKQVLANLATGRVDILVGTHRLLNRDVRYKDLGLLIIDEEHRFGVAHKETIKNLKRSVDVLTLSATPIPRTLHMSMVGIRDMSVLETPPEERYPVQTYVLAYQDGVVRDAILREIARGGQAYFLYNRVEHIERFHARLSRLVPEARIAVAHGQMREHALEDVMMDFYEGKYDVLLCTTIIESGLDIPTANTLIVFDADRFGLAQLYQIRGRVGRSNRLAFAYLTVRPDKMLTEAAEKRLQAIREFTEFGSGFRIAMRDLELRGAGNILGPEQSGQMSAVGYDMYVKLIEETVREIRGEMGETVDVETRVELQVDAYLPSEYVRGEGQRMEAYKRIAAIGDRTDREDVWEELTDRFGDPPEPVRNLMDIAQLKSMCSALGIEAVWHRGGQLVMRFSKHAVIDGKRLFVALHDTDKRLVLAAQSPPSLLLRDGRLDTPAMLREGVRLMEVVTQRMRGQVQEDASQT
ncbi:MAG: transcription-repair coupling factor [Oscillospiraceae bacterium]|nr:transcription-repair coupling factor [Oscillospiraceae bacterium]